MATEKTKGGTRPMDKAHDMARQDWVLQQVAETQAALMKSIDLNARAADEKLDQVLDLLGKEIDERKRHGDNARVILRAAVHRLEARANNAHREAVHLTAAVKVLEGRWWVNRLRAMFRRQPVGVAHKGVALEAEPPRENPV